MKVATFPEKSWSQVLKKSVEIITRVCQLANLVKLAPGLLAIIFSKVHFGRISEKDANVDLKREKEGNSTDANRSMPGARKEMEEVENYERLSRKERESVPWCDGVGKEERVTN